MISMGIRLHPQVSLWTACLVVALFIGFQAQSLLALQVQELQSTYVAAAQVSSPAAGQQGNSGEGDIVANLERALALTPGDARTKIRLSRAYLAVERFDEASALIQEVVAVDSTNPSAFFVQGRVLQCLRRGDEAVASYRKSIAIRQENPYAFNNLGFIYVLRGEYEEAVDALEKAVAQKSDVSYFFNNLGMAYEGAGDFEKARDSFERALEIDPDYAKAETNLHRVERRLGINLEPEMQQEEAFSAFELADESSATPAVAASEPETSQGTPDRPESGAAEVSAPEPAEIAEAGTGLARAGVVAGDQSEDVIVKILGVACLTIILAVGLFVRSHRRSDFSA